MPKRLRTLKLMLPMLGCLLLSACATTGYSPEPNYREDIRTVYVPIFENYTFRRGLEFDLTREVANQIDDHTPYRIVSCKEDADTELTGVIRIADKQLYLRNQQNTIREAQTRVIVEVVWKDLRSGEILSAPREGRAAPLINQRLAEPPLLEPQPQPGAPPPQQPPLPPEVVAEEPPPTTVQSVSTFIPELGSSITSSYHKNIEKLAQRIVHLMEKPW